MTRPQKAELPRVEQMAKSPAVSPSPTNVALPTVSLRVRTPEDFEAEESGETSHQSQSQAVVPDGRSQEAPSVTPAMQKTQSETSQSLDAPRPVPDERFLKELSHESDLLETATPLEILQWAVDRFAPKFAMATAFGPEGMVLIHLLAQIAPQTHIFNLETGYQFAETLELREQVKRRYGIEVEFKRPTLSVEEYERQNGGPVYRLDPNRCCAQRKIGVLMQAAANYSAWASAIRRDQSSDRGRAPIVGWDKKFGLVKVSPLANWTKQQVWSMITKQDIPYNPLHDQGYTSIGCWPCTRSVLPGEDERAGRWSGFAKTECGLHTSD